MMFSQSPCMDCTGRYIGCHSDCTTFQQWKAEEARKNKELGKTLNVERVFAQVQAEKNTRISRRLHSARNRGYRVR